MKKIFNIFSAALAAAFMVASCDLYQPEVDTWQPGEKDVEGCYGIYFPSQDFSEYQYLNPTAPCEVEMKIARSVSTGQITVPITVTASEAGIFDIPAVAFADGQSEASFTVTFDKAATGTKYTLSLAVTDPQYVSTYGNMPTFLDFSVMRVEWKYFTDPAGNKAQFTFDQMPFWEEIHTGYVKYYEIDGVRYCVTETDPIEDGTDTVYGFWGTADAQGEGEVSFEWYPNVKTAAGNQAILVKNCPVWYASNYGEMVYRWDWYEYWTIYNPQAALAGVTFPQFVKDYSSNYPVSYYDGNGTFVFHCAYYRISAGSFVSDIDDVSLIADGFTRVDYSLDIEPGFSYKGELPVYFKAGADVAAIKVSAAEGELSEAGVAELEAGIISGEVEALDVDMSDLAIGLSFEKTGLYTVVAVAYDEAGAPQNSAYAYATYVSEEDEEDYAVVATVGLEAIPERYGLPEFSTAAYYIAGKDLTDVHYSIVATSSITSQQVLNEILRTIKFGDKYQVSPEELAQINAVGGLYDYETGLKDGTEYALIVWATNGMLEKFYMETYTTPKKPYEWNLLGKGTLNEPFTTMFGEDPLVIPVDVYQEKNNPGLYMYKGVGLALANWFYDQDMSAYEGQYWDDEGIIFDATDPSKVVIDNQYYGFNAGSSYGWPVITTIANGQTVGYGKLADGHLTLTAREYLVGMGTSFYYGPAGYDLALPSVAQASNVVVKNYVEKPMVDESGKSVSVKSDFSEKDFAANKISISRDVTPVPVKGSKVTGKKPANKNRTSAPVPVDRKETIKK